MKNILPALSAFYIFFCQVNVLVARDNSQAEQLSGETWRVISSQVDA